MAQLGLIWLGLAWLGLAQLGLTWLGCIQPIAFEKLGPMFPVVNPIFPAELRLLRPLLGLDFEFTNLSLNFLRASSRPKYYSTPQPVFELFPQSTLLTIFRLLVSRTFFL